MLIDSHNAYLTVANQIPNWKTLTKTEVANLYCDADENKDELKRSQYFAVLMCQYWYMVPHMYTINQGLVNLLGLDYEDFLGWLDEALLLALKYRRWRNPEFTHLFANPRGAEIVINRSIFSVQKRWYKFYNEGKRRGDFFTYSLDESIEKFGDSAEGVATEGLLVEEGVRGIVQKYIDKDKLVEALILDGICYQDSYITKGNIIESTEQNSLGHKITYTQTNYEFSSTKLVKHFFGINKQYINYFLDTYTVDKSKLINVVETLSKHKKTKLSLVIRNQLKALKNSKELRTLLCL